MVTYGLEQDGALRSDGLLASLVLPFTLRKPPRQAVRRGPAGRLGADQPAAALRMPSIS